MISKVLSSPPPSPPFLFFFFSYFIRDARPPESISSPFSFFPPLFLPLFLDPLKEVLSMNETYEYAKAPSLLFFFFLFFFLLLLTVGPNMMQVLPYCAFFFFFFSFFSPFPSFTIFFLGTIGV